MFLPLSLIFVFGLAPTVAQESEALQDPEQPASQGEEPLVFAEVGFSIGKPDASWAVRTSPDSGPINTLAMGPADQEGRVQVSVQISAAGFSGMEKLRQERDGLLTQIGGTPGIHDGRTLEMQIGGLTAPGLQVEQDALGDTFLVRQAYLVAQGLHYKFQFHAPKGVYSDYEPLFEQVRESFAIVPLAREALRDSRLRELSARCGSEVEQLGDWGAASKRATERGQLIVVAVQALSGFQIADAISRGPFMDQDIIRLLEQRFVVLRWQRGMGAPFESHDVFGMSASTFGVGLLVVTPEGDVVRQMFLLSPEAVYDGLIDTLLDHPDLAAPTPPADVPRQGRIEFLLHSGQLAAAEAELASFGSSEGLIREAWLNGELQRLYHNGAAALEALDRALNVEETRTPRAPAMRHELQGDRAVLLALVGRAAEAESAFDELLALSDGVAANTRARALKWKGALRYQAKDKAGAKAHWDPLLDQFPDSRWAWSVADALTDPSWGLEAFPNLAWVEPDHRRLAELPTPASGAPVSLDQMVTTAADYLLATQADGGCWTPPSAYGDTEARADEFEIAATVLAGRGLLRLHDRPAAQAAAGRALKWVLNQRELRQEQGELPVAFMDYRVWSRSYCVFFLAECIEAEFGDQVSVREELDRCVRELLERQQPNGGWSYYLSGAVGGEALPQSIGFTTATVVLALERAGQVGGVVEEDELERGLLCLEALRSPEGTFAYFLNGRDVATGQLSGTSPEGSAARGPACSLALLRAGREDVTALVPRLELYVKHLPGFGAQRRKALMHAGAHTQGSHYLLYDYSTAAEALLEAGPAGLDAVFAQSVRAEVLRELRACRNADGSYVDNPLIGTDIGTGLALNGLLDLQEGGEAND